MATKINSPARVGRMTEDQVDAFFARYREWKNATPDAAAIETETGWAQYVTPENTVGTDYSPTLCIRDAKHGNTVIHRVSDADADLDAVLASMKKELKARAKATRARIAAERSVNRS